MSFALFRDDFRFELQWGALFPATVLTLIAISQLGVRNGLIGAGLLFASLIAHECGHLVMALLLHVPIKAVGLCWAGAFTRRQASGDPRSELAIALSGPLITIALMIICLGWGEVGLWLATMNFFVAVTNLLPFGNSDGQRAFRALRACLANTAAAASSHISLKPEPGFVDHD